MEGFVEEYCTYFELPYNEIMQSIYDNKIIKWEKNKAFLLNLIITYKINVNNFIFTEDVPKIYSIICSRESEINDCIQQAMTYKKFVKFVKKHSKYYKLDIHNLSIKTCTDCGSIRLVIYYLGTFLGHQDIKIAIKD